MTRFWRTLAAAAALNMVTAGAAAAQTVLVRFATPGEKVEVVLNSATVASGTVGTDGVVKIPFVLPAEWMGAGMDARISIDACPNVRRVHLVERNAVVPPTLEGCSRTEISGLYLVRRENTLVVSIGPTIPTLLMVKGNFSLKPPAPAPKASRGLVLYGGGGLASLPDSVGHACGNADACSGDDNVGIYTGGASLWVFKWLAIDGSYVKPSKPTAKGESPDSPFTTDTDLEILNAGGKIAVPVNRVRLYLTGGATFTRATTKTVQTIDGASQTFVFKTEGVGWYAGGGIEVWATKWFGLYAEGSRSQLKGKPTDDVSEGQFREGMSTAVLGARIRIF